MKDKFKMDSHKLFWHLDRVLEWQNGKRIAPLHIDFGITTGCNMACKYCYGMIQARTNKIKRFDMPKETIINFLTDAKEIGVRSVAFIGEGENTLNPALYDSLAHAKKIGLDVSLATNGLPINRDKIELLMSSLKWIRFNISAGTPETYESMHNVPKESFEILKENIRLCVEAKKRLNLDTAIGMQMVLMNEAIGDIIPLAKLGKELGVDYFVVKPVSDTPDKKLNGPTTEYRDIQDIFKEAESYSTDDYFVSIKWAKLMNGGLKDYKVCYGTQFILAISGNGNVLPCGHWFDIRNDEFLMGNIIKSRFKDIVAGERYWNVQKRIRKVDVNHECESNCRQHYINEFLYKLSEKPKHINFI
jgi:radical SAM protein with 4Fe4S-binding SPASM domain